MFEKGGKFFADRRDKSGNRKWQSFATSRAVLAHEAEQKALAHPKDLASRPRSPHYNSPSSRRLATPK
jgi:hypothetical protein